MNCKHIVCDSRKFRNKNAFYYLFIIKKMYLWGQFYKINGYDIR